MDIKEFKDKMEGFFSKARKVKEGREYLDCCGRECHSASVFVMPAALKDDFLKFVSDVGRPSWSALHDLDEGATIPSCDVVIGYINGKYSHPGVYRDYDGIQECDMAPVEAGGQGWMMLNFSIGTKRGGNVAWEPLAEFGITRYWQCTTPYAEGHWAPFRNVVCFE